MRKVWVRVGEKKQLWSDMKSQSIISKTLFGRKIIRKRGRRQHLISHVFNNGLMNFYPKVSEKRTGNYRANEIFRLSHGIHSWVTLLSNHSTTPNNAQINHKGQMHIKICFAPKMFVFDMHLDRKRSKKRRQLLSGNAWFQKLCKNEKCNYLQFGADIAENYDVKKWQRKM